MKINEIVEGLKESPEKIKDVQKEIIKSIQDLDVSKSESALIERNHKININSEEIDGKAKYSNAEKRDLELQSRLSLDAAYQKFKQSVEEHEKYLRALKVELEYLQNVFSSRKYLVRFMEINKGDE